MMISTKQKKQFIFLILAALWGCLIYYLSATPYLKSPLPSEYDFFFRKLAHIFVFFVLTYLVASSLHSKQKGFLLFVIIAAVSYALIDELHQSFVPGRVGSHKDILVDAIGVYMGVWLYREKPPHKLLKFIK